MLSTQVHISEPISVTFLGIVTFTKPHIGGTCWPPDNIANMILTTQSDMSSYNWVLLNWILSTGKSLVHRRTVNHYVKGPGNRRQMVDYLLRTFLIVMYITSTNAQPSGLRIGRVSSAWFVNTRSNKNTRIWSLSWINTPVTPNWRPYCVLLCS